MNTMKGLACLKVFFEINLNFLFLILIGVQGYAIGGKVGCPYNVKTQFF